MLDSPSRTTEELLRDVWAHTDEIVYLQNTGTIEIGMLLLPTIRVLNDKGYCTSHCCSGHFNGGKGEEGYVQFQEDITSKMFKTSPKGTYFDPNSPDQVCLRWKFLGKDESSLHHEIVKMSLDLLHWAEHMKPRR
jgi:hypothetical protein